MIRGSGKKMEYRIRLYKLGEPAQKETFVLVLSDTMPDGGWVVSPSPAAHSELRLGLAQIEGDNEEIRSKILSFLQKPAYAKNTVTSETDTHMVGKSVWQEVPQGSLEYWQTSLWQISTQVKLHLDHGDYKSMLALKNEHVPGHIKKLITRWIQRGFLSDDKRSLIESGTVAVPALIQLFYNKEWVVGFNAAKVLVSIGEPAVLPLIKALKDADWIDAGVRSNAIRALGEIGDPRAVEPILNSLKDEKNSVRESAVTALGKLKDVRAVLPLIELLKVQDEERSLHGSLVYALGQIDDPRAIDILIKVLNEDNYYLRRNAANALGKFNNYRARKALLKYRLTYWLKSLIQKTE